MVDLICKDCGDSFSVKPYRVETAKFCSQSCSSRFTMRGNQFNKGRAPWNKGLKGIHLNPANEFKKGSVPWNKGIKGTHFSPKTEFKKGHKNENKQPIGTIRVRKHKDDYLRSFIKIANPDVWEIYARYVWKEHHGKIPNGMLIHHKDRDTLNDDIDNLQMMTRAEHIEEHRYD